MIDEALGQEESELLRRIGGEPNLAERALGLFGAGVGWPVALMMLLQTAMFIAGVWAAWNFFQAAEPFTQLRWGLPAAVLLLMSLIVKLAVVPAIHHNRIMRELKRIELQIARTRA
jgi:membrane protein YdbS with pleckstrin-like domain